MKIGTPRPWEPHDILTLCWAGTAVGDAERRIDEGWTERPPTEADYFLRRVPPKRNYAVRRRREAA
jgi:hypothetical protein